jgi:hypothetical protein
MRGSTSTSARALETTSREARPSGSRTTTRGGLSTMRPRRGKRAPTRTRVARRPPATRAGPGSTSSSIVPEGSGSRPQETTRSTVTGWPSRTRRAPTVRVTRTPRAARTTHAVHATATTTKATPGT